MRSEPGSPPLVVELLGLPGAGKTTVASQLVELLAERGMRADTITTAGREYARSSRTGRAVAGVRGAGRGAHRARRALEWNLFATTGAVHAVRFALEHPAFSRTVIVGQARRDIPVIRRLQIIRSFLRLCGRHRCLTAAPDITDVLVVDDGFVHRAVELHASAFAVPDLDLVPGYLDAVPAPALVVVADASRATCERRVRDRGLWRHSRGLTPAQLSTYLRGADAVVSTAAARATDLGWRVVRVDNDGCSIDELRRALDAALRAELGISPDPMARAEVPA